MEWILLAFREIFRILLFKFKFYLFCEKEESVSLQNVNNWLAILAYKFVAYIHIHSRTIRKFFALKNQNSRRL